jgi:hypothetical protein
LMRSSEVDMLARAASCRAAVIEDKVNASVDVAHNA